MVRVRLSRPQCVCVAWNGDSRQRVSACFAGVAREVAARGLLLDQGDDPPTSRGDGQRRGAADAALEQQLQTGFQFIEGPPGRGLLVQPADQFAGVFIGMAFLGALLGFLPYNFPPARIFLGDTGALFIGFNLSLLSLEGYRKVSVLTFVVPLLALAVPLLDTALSIYRRLRRGGPIMAPDRQHMHHRLLDSEGSHRSAVLSIWFLTACFCVIAVSFTNLEGTAALIFLALVLVLTLRLLRNLGFFEIHEHPRSDSEEKHS